MTGPGLLQCPPHRSTCNTHAGADAVDSVFNTATAIIRRRDRRRSLPRRAFDALFLFAIIFHRVGALRFSFIFRSDRFTSARPSRKPVRGCIAAFPFNTRMSVAGVIFFTGVRCRSTRRSAGKLQHAPAAVEDSEIVCRRTHVAHYTLSSSARRTRRVFVYCTLYTRPHTPLGTSPAPPPTPVDPTFGAPRNPKFRRCRGVQ